MLFTWPRCAAVLASIGILLATSSARAQNIEFPRRPLNTTQLEKMRSGTSDTPPSAAKNQELFAELAKWLAYRVVHPPFNGLKPATPMPGAPEDIETLMTEAEKWCGWPNPNALANAQQNDYAKEFGKEFEREIMYVMDNTVAKLEKANAARMLAIVGKLPYEGIADRYLSIIKEDKYPPEIKLFAFQGLRNLLSLPDSITPVNHVIKSNPKLEEIVKTLDQYIMKPIPAKATSEDIRVIQFIRREAVRALAQMRLSVVRQNQMPLAKPIWTLLRVATNDGLTNTPGKNNDKTLPGYPYQILERIEAVIGICSMLPDKDLNLDVVVHIVNEAMQDIMAFHDAERGAYEKDMRNKPLVPWRIMGNRLTTALKLWKANTEKLPATRNPKFVADFADQAIQKCTSKLETDGVTARPDARIFADWKRDHKVKTPQVLGEDDTTKVTIK